MIFLGNAVENTSLIWIMSSILVFKAYIYDFLLLIGSVNLLIFNLAGLREEVDLGALGATCYNLMTLGLIKEKNLVLGLIQENSIESFIQDCLPYILDYHVPCYYFSSLL